MKGSSALQRIASRAGPAREPEQRCDLCAAPLPEHHRHLLDTAAFTAACACQACAILFDTDAEVRYRPIPTRRIRLEADPAIDDHLPVPVGIAFYWRARDGQIAAAYPSPFGITRSELSIDAWDAVERCHPALREMAPEVEAFLVHTARGASERWLVPIDDCFRLVAEIRTRWQGFTGGDEVWERIDAFFATLAGESHAEEESS